jgi:hypothetical protein
MTEKASNKKKHRFPNSFNRDMNEMMQNFCSNSDWDSKCCPQFMRMHSSRNDCDDSIMTICERMREMCFYSELKSEEK